MNKFIVILLTIVFNIFPGEYTQLSTPEEFIIKYEKASPYQILNVTKESRPEEIKKAFRQLSLRWHPDKWAKQEDNQNATQAFKIINSAYQKLINPQGNPNFTQNNPQSDANYQENKIKLDTETTLNLNTKIPESWLTFKQELEERRIQNLPLIVIKATTSTQSYPLTTVQALNREMNYRNLTIFKEDRPLLINQYPVIKIDYYIIDSNNTVIKKTVSYPITYSGEQFEQIKEIVASDLSSDEISQLLHIVQMSDTRTRYQYDDLLAKIILKNSQITFTKKLEILSLIDSYLKTKISFKLLAQANTQQADALLNIIKGNISSVNLMDIRSLLNSNLANKELIAYDLLLDYINYYLKASDSFSVAQALQLIITILHSPNIKVEDKLRYEQIILNTLSSLPVETLYNIVTHVDSQDSIMLKLYETITRNPHVTTTQKANILKKIADIWYNGAKDIQKNVSRALQIYEYISSNQALFSVLEILSQLLINFTIAEIYKNGAQYVEKDFLKAVKYYELVANSKINQKWQTQRFISQINLLKAQSNFELGLIYFQGNYQIPQNLKKSKDYFRAILRINAQNVNNIQQINNLKFAAHNYLNQIQTRLKVIQDEEKAQKKLELQSQRAAAKENKKRKPTEDEIEGESPLKKAKSPDDTDTDLDEEMNG